MLARFAASPALKAGVIYVVGGVAFAAANLVFARVYSADAFAAITLFLAAVHLAATLGPLGADTIVNRNTVDPSTDLLGRVILTCLVIAAAAALVIWQFYGLPALTTMFVAAAGLFAGLNLVGAAFFRSRGRFQVSLGMTQGQNLVLAVAAMIALLVVPAPPALPYLVVTAGYALSAIIGWRAAFRLDRRADALSHAAFPWHEGRTIIGTSVAILLLLQLERLAIPKLLDREALATFAVLAAIAGSPFRVLQMGVGYTLVPRLRNSRSSAGTLQIIRGEAGVVLALAVAATALIWLVTQPFLDWFLQGRYEITKLMIAAALVSGYGKVVMSFGSATITALGTSEDLKRLRHSAWTAVAIALAGAVTGAGYGLVGVLFGISAGWVFHAVRALWVARTVLAPLKG